MRFNDLRLEAIDARRGMTSARIISSRSGGYGLTPDLPPDRNFDRDNLRTDEEALRFANFSVSEVRELTSQWRRLRTDPLKRNCCLRYGVWHS